jgi:hypothetical protein
MSARARRPTDEVATKVFDEDGRQRTMPAPFESFELDATEVTPMPGRAQVEQATPPHIDPAPPAPGAPVAAMRGAHRSEPIRVISMKQRTEAEGPRSDEPRVPLHVQLRSIAEVAGLHDTPPGGLGNLAPPRDPHEARARRRRDNAIWVCVAIVLACAVMLAFWLVAGR